MSGLVDEGVIVARLPWLRIGAIALPQPLISGPMAATTLGSETNLRALIAACAGSYWPAVVVPSSSTITSMWYPATPPAALASSTAIIAPFLMRTAFSASDPVSGTSMPTVTLWAAARTWRARSTRFAATAAAGNWARRARRVVMVPSPARSRCASVFLWWASFAPKRSAQQATPRKPARQPGAFLTQWRRRAADGAAPRCYTQCVGDAARNSRAAHALCGATPMYLYWYA